MKPIPAARWVPQLGILALVVGGATARNLGAGPVGLPELRALCPTGAVTAIAGALFSPGTIGMDLERLLVPAGVILATIVLGPVFCGRLCPLGTVQEWVGRLGRRFLGRRYNRLVPGDRYLRHLRWVVLALVAAAGAGFVAFETDLINPSLALIHGWTSAVPVAAIAVAAIVVAGSFLVERPWCRWLCPYGVLLGTIGRLSPWTIRRNKGTCIDCGLCDRRCPLAITVSTVDAVRDDRCNRCSNCIESCPVDGAVALRTSPDSRGVAAVPLSAAALAIVLAPVFLVNAITAEAAPEERSATGLSSESITPMMTLETLAEQAGLSHEELGTLLGLPEEWDTTIGPAMILLDLEEELGLEHVTVGYIRSLFETEEE